MTRVDGHLSEHLALVSRWFYSKPRDGEILFKGVVWPYRRIMRAWHADSGAAAGDQGPWSLRQIHDVRVMRLSSNFHRNNPVVGNAPAWTVRRTIIKMQNADTEEALPAPPELATPSPRSRFEDMFRSLRHRNFQLFFSGQLISLIGTWMQNVAQAWLVYALTGSPLLLGVVGFAGQIPIFLFARSVDSRPIGGTGTAW